MFRVQRLELEIGVGSLHARAGPAQGCRDRLPDLIMLGLQGLRTETLYICTMMF